MKVKDKEGMKFKKPYCITVIGGLGAGKSTYAMSRINVPDCSKLGVYNWKGELRTLNLGGCKRHEEDNRKIGIDYQRTSLSTIVRDITNIRKPQLFIDEWTILYSQFSFFCNEEKMLGKADEIIGAINSNPSLDLAVIVCSSKVDLSYFRRHKKKALWIRKLVHASDEVVRVEFGIPEKIDGVY